MTVEIYRWVGTALMPSISDLNSVLLKDLNAAFESVTDSKPKPSRYRRSDLRRMEKEKLSASAETLSTNEEISKGIRLINMKKI